MNSINKKIYQLLGLTSPANDDELVIRDTSESKTKKISVLNLFKNIVAQILDRAKYRGDFSAETAYQKNDVVFYSGQSYVALQDSTGNLPTDIIYWKIFASKGLKGDTGATGLQGVQGIKGDKGEKGATGSVGAKGETGSKGDKGEKGEIGARGLKGNTGDTGPQGLKGDKGDQGEKGATGSVGAKGETGSKGAKGDQGEKGDKGETGDQGIQGDQGPQGEQGVAGDTGTPGADGSLSYRGTLDASSQDYPGDAVAGDYWVISVAGNIEDKPFGIGDWIVYNGTYFDKIDNQGGCNNFDYLDLNKHDCQPSVPDCGAIERMYFKCGRFYGLNSENEEIFFGPYDFIKSVQCCSGEISLVNDLADCGGCPTQNANKLYGFDDAGNRGFRDIWCILMPTNSIQYCGGQLSLVCDVPGDGCHPNMYYGTDENGYKGWLPASLGAYSGKYSINLCPDNSFELVGDETAESNEYYGIDSMGNRGFYPIQNLAGFTAEDSIELCSGCLHLRGDVPDNCSPYANYYYGTDSCGNKGWYCNSNIGGGSGGGGNMNWRGDWNAGENYNVNDVVLYNGISYIAISQTYAWWYYYPDSQPSYWKPLDVDSGSGSIPGVQRSIEIDSCYNNYQLVGDVDNACCGNAFMYYGTDGCGNKGFIYLPPVTCTIQFWDRDSNLHEIDVVNGFVTCMY